MDDSLIGQTVEAARRVLAKRFMSAGIETAELDARLLIGEALKLDLTGLIASASRRLGEADAALLDAFARRRIAREPVARILGQKEFWGLPLKLSRETLVPRPETETVVELALDMLRSHPISGTARRIADIGTGSGAILLALLSELPDAFGVGTDVSVAALRTAKHNGEELGLASRAAFVACDYAASLSGTFDLIASNPPYVRATDIDGLSIEVRQHDPRRALDGGADGLAAYRAIIPQATRLLASGGILVVEAGQNQAGDVEGLMTAAGLSPDSPAKTDLAGIPRAVGGRKRPR